MCRRFKSREAGNVTVEFVGIVLGLLIPVLNVAMAGVNVAHSYLVQENAVRAGARVASVSETFSPAVVRQVVTTILSDNHVSAGQVSLQVACSDHPCDSPQSVIQVSILRKYRITLLGVLSRTITIKTQHALVRGVG